MTESEAQTHLDAWIAADTAISTGKAYTIGNRSLTRSDAAEVTRQITFWQRTVKTQSALAKGYKNPGIVISTWN